MARKKKDPYASYDVVDWQWEFLRRNRRYRRLYKAVQRAQERNWGFEYADTYEFVDQLWVSDIRARLSLCCPPTIDDFDSEEDYTALPSPEIARYGFAYCPVERSAAQIISAPYPPGYVLTELDKIVLKGGDLFGVESKIPSEHRITIHIDDRFRLENILLLLRKELRQYRKKDRNHVRIYKDYLAVWDLFQEGSTAEKSPRHCTPRNMLNGAAIEMELNLH